jgi:hypothetical protein
VVSDRTRTRRSRLTRLLLLLAPMAACGGHGTTGPTASAPTHGGTYSGVMTYSDDHSRTTARTTVSQDGDTVTFTPLTVSTPEGGAYELGSAALGGDGSFSGSSSYDAPVCGPIASVYQGRFKGDSLHLKVSLTATSPPPGAWCSPFGLEGDLTR